MDLAQAELKIIAHLIQEPTMLHIFDQGQDIHAYFGAVLCFEEFMVLKEKEPEKYKRYRNIAKVIFFMI